MNAGPHPTALITGVAGQDGSYLAELLLGRGWTVHGVSKPGGTPEPVNPLVEQHETDLSDHRAATALITETAPDYVFHLAGISSVWKSWNDPVLTTRVNGVSAAALLDACFTQQEASGKRIVLINASSAEIFAGSGVSLQSETTRIAPTSPYGASKALSHHMVDVYRSRGLEQPMPFSTTTSHRGGRIRSSPGRSARPRSPSLEGTSPRSNSATSLPCAIGAGPRTM